MGAILPLRYPSHCVLRSAAPALLLLLPLAPAAAATPPTGFSLALLHAVVLDEPALALAFVDDSRLAVLFGDSVGLYRVEGSNVRRAAHRPLDGPLAAVRRPGGLIVPGEDAFWALSSRMPEAVLFATDADRLEARAKAAALPWPGSPLGLRYRDGTDLLESAAGLLLAPPLQGLAVDREGRVLALGPEGPVETKERAGPAVAALEEGLVAAASADPPGPADAIQLLRPQGDDVRLLDSLPVSGAVRALAGRRLGSEFRLAAVVETEHGFELRLLRLLRGPS